MTVAFGSARTATDRPQAARRAADTALPWDLAVESASANGQGGTFAKRRQLLVAGFFVLVFMVLLATYLIFRAVSRGKAEIVTSTGTGSQVAIYRGSNTASLNLFPTFLTRCGDLHTLLLSVAYALLIVGIIVTIGRGCTRRASGVSGR